MITKADINQAEQFLTDSQPLNAREQSYLAARHLLEIKTVCSFCGAHLSGSLHAPKTSHGMCKPLCAEALKMGWGDVKKGAA